MTVKRTNIEVMRESIAYDGWAWICVSGDGQRLNENNFFFANEEEISRNIIENLLLLHWF